MSTSLLYHAFGTRGYRYVRTTYTGGEVIFTLRQAPETCRCSACGSHDVVSRGHVERRFRSLPIGPRATSLVLPIPRVECRACGRGAPGRRHLRRPAADLHQGLRAVRPGTLPEDDHPGRGRASERRLGPGQGHPEARPVAPLRQAQAQAPAADRHRRDRRRQGPPVHDHRDGPGQRRGGVRGRRQGGRRAEAVLEAAAAQRGEDRGGGHGHVGGVPRRGLDPPEEGGDRLRPLPRHQAVQRQAVRPAAVAVPPGRGRRGRRCSRGRGGCC